MATGGRHYSVAEAARILGYSRQQANHYVKTEQLSSFTDPETGTARVTRKAIQEFLTNPPRGARPGGKTNAVAIADMDALARRVALLEQADQDLDVVLDRVERLEEDMQQTPAGQKAVQVLPDAGPDTAADMWRRRANGALDAVAEIAAVGNLYESAIDLLREAQRLQREADTKRGEADTVLDGARRAWLNAVTAFSTPNDPGEIPG